MKIKRHKDFLLESKDIKLPLKYMNNEDRKVMQDFFNLLNIIKFEDLPSYTKKFDGDLDDKVASYLYDPTIHKKVLSKYSLKDYGYIDFIEMIDRYGINWNDQYISSSDYIGSVQAEITDFLSDEKIIDSTNNFIFLSDEEEKALPSMMTIDKFNL